MERNTLKNSTALQAVAGFAAGAAILGLAAWWYQSGKVRIKLPRFGTSDGRAHCGPCQSKVARSGG